jgi:hypothetical protein
VWHFPPDPTAVFAHAHPIRLTGYRVGLAYIAAYVPCQEILSPRRRDAKLFFSRLVNKRLVGIEKLPKNPEATPSDQVLIHFDF